MKETRRGLAHFCAAFGYSMQGLGAAIRHESAFRLELVLGVIHYVLLFMVPMESAWQLALALAWPFLLVTELLNSAIENVVDLASPDWHALAKRAKDMASAAVLIASLVPAGLWLWVFVQLAMRMQEAT